jgi:hypothetical protein
MTAITTDAVWTLRRDNEHGSLASSLQMAEAIEDLAETAEFEASAVTAAANAVRGDVADRRRKLDALSPAAVGAVAWRDLRNEARESKQLLARHVSLLQGALLRHLTAVREQAVAADRYLTELGGLCGVTWEGVALPGVADEQERHHGSVRFAFASSGFWDLPVLAHEFGHVVEGARRTTGLDGIEQSLSLQELVNRLSEEHRRPVSVVREYLSDAFAVYVAGPAYVCALVLLRLDPSADPRVDPRGTHPSDGRRAAAALTALGRLDGARPSAFTGIASTLDATWGSMIEAAGGRPPDDAADDLRLLDAMWPELEHLHRARFTAVRRNRAAQLERQLDDPDMSSPTSIGDLLMAGWMFRFRLLSQGKDVDRDLGDRLLERIAALPVAAGRR